MKSAHNPQPSRKLPSKTKPQVFIIETLEFKDEDLDLYEGRRISDMLRLGGKDCHYVYIRTKAELESVLEKFWDSNYRYLHLSCHGNSHGMTTTLNEDISFAEMGKIFGPYLERRRLFISGCKMTCHNLAKELIPKTDCFSILGPADKPNFADAAIFWASFYHCMFRHNEIGMVSRIMREKAAELASFFSIPMNFFVSDHGELKFHKIRPQPNFAIRQT